MDGEALQRAHADMRAAYWERKDLDEVCRIAREAIRGASGVTDVRSRGWVKAIAYDLASFTWPGWDESEITVSPEQLRAGADAAELNLELAVALERPPNVMAMAHWIVGAHRLAAGDRDAARASFDEAAAFATKAGDAAQEALVRGYAAIAARDAPALEEAEVALAVLEDGPTYVAQLDTAARLLS